MSGGSVLTLGIAGCLGGDESSEGSDEPNESDSDDTDDSDDNEGTDDHESHDHETEHEVGKPVAEIEVEMVTNDDGKHFGPHVVHVESGGTVRWVLKSGSHDTTAYHPETHGDQQRIPDGAEPWASDLLSDEGDTFERTFDVEGVYDYACTPHEGAGMIGTVVVGWPAPDDQPGLAPPADDRPDAAIDQLERYNEQVRTVLEEGDGAGTDGNETAGDSHDHEH
ncbi:plastocyanin/azurin family copper-binding protein [Natrinema salaciae]|uniref:Plastocyanin n=1 Tax=Natrinema salaciae TaxID=1186196 RepID=A0A1H9R2C5_9EURY|nr:plastocyanin/azurin family copper-binding protein [Natrinema salaciae]SER66886.1 Plastocyanin [Natrinema salaciae]